MKTAAKKRGRKRINYLHPAVKRAMDRNGGTLRKLADKLNISPQALAQWGARIPVAHVKVIEALSGVPREKLRPDVFRR